MQKAKNSIYYSIPDISGVRKNIKEEIQMGSLFKKHGCGCNEESSSSSSSPIVKKKKKKVVYESSSSSSSSSCNSCQCDFLRTLHAGIRVSVTVTGVATPFSLIFATFCEDTCCATFVNGSSATPTGGVIVISCDDIVAIQVNPAG